MGREIHHMRLRTLLIICTVLLAAVLSAPAIAQKKPIIARFTSNVVSMNMRKSTVLEIVVHEWTSENDRLALHEAFNVGGNEQLYKLLHAWGKDSKAFVRVNGSLAYQLSYAYTYKSEDGMDNYILASARPIGFLEVVNNARTLDQDISLIVFAVDEETGRGEGRAAAGVEFGQDKSGQLQLRHVGTKPANLTKVIRRIPAPEKKKK